MSEGNKNTVRRLFEEVWNKGNLPVADELFASTYAPMSGEAPKVRRRERLSTARPSPIFD
jgi:hypothetical protein